MPRENLTRAEATQRAALLSSVAYDVVLDLTGGDTFVSETTVRFEATDAGTSTFVDFTARTIHHAELNGRTLEQDALEPTRIRLDGLQQGRNELRVRATMDYQHTGNGLHHFRDPVDGEIYLHSQFEPFDAHLVFACFDQPDLKAPWTLRVVAPAGWVVVSNAAVEERPAEGTTGTWRFATTPRLSPYVMAVVAGAYVSVHDRHGDVPLGLYARRSMREHIDADELFELTKQGLDWYTDAFDQPYPFGKYDQLFVPEFFAGAMENPGCVTFREEYLFRSKVTAAAHERRAETILHEMAHMWFGDLVTMRWWDDLWLNESFASFMAVLSQVEATRFGGGWVTFLDSEKAWAKYQDQLPTTHPVAADMVDIESVHQNFDGITYAKGASVLRHLVAWVGQDAFLEGCRRYFAKHAYDNAELTDFLAALEAASGRELADWRHAWLGTSGINTLAATYDVREDGTYRSFAIQQEGEVLRPHRVAIGVYDRHDDELVRRDRVELDVTGATTAVEDLTGRPAGAAVVVNDDDLTYAKVRLDPRTTSEVTQRLRAFSDPLARALLWSATWDMVRDADLPAGSFLTIVLANADAEGDVGVLQRLLRRASAAAERYGDPGCRDERLTHVATHARDQLAAAAPGGDHQLAWVRAWASSAREDAQLEEVRALLDGAVAFDGLDVDTELRWHLVTSLARVGAASDDLIAAERRRDDTNFGERHAATARAARPDPAAKQAAWDRLINEPDLTHTMAAQLMAGIQQLHQPDLLAPYAERYFEALPGVFERRQLKWAIEFAQGMFPHAVADDDLLAQTDDFLQRRDLPAPMRRALLEERDVLVRTLAARRLDAPS